MHRWFEPRQCCTKKPKGGSGNPKATNPIVWVADAGIRANVTPRLLGDTRNPVLQAARAEIWVRSSTPASNWKFPA
jgi:hypothetical protein